GSGDTFGRPHPGRDAAHDPSRAEQTRRRHVADHRRGISGVGASDCVRMAGSRDRERWAGRAPELHRWIRSAALREPCANSHSVSSDTRSPEPSLAAAPVRRRTVGAPAFGSRGQQRLTALALRLAEILPVTEAAGTAPILLLDDALSELDPTVRGHVLHEIQSAEQVFLTTPDIPAVDGAAMFHVN